MSPSLFQQLLKHRRTLALATLASWALCAVLVGCLMGETKNSSVSSPSVNAELAKEHRVDGHASDHSSGHGHASGLMKADTCCEAQHEAVSVPAIFALLIPLGLALAILLPGLSLPDAAWLRQYLLPFRIRPPRYHLVYCTLLH